MMNKNLQYYLDRKETAEAEQGDAFELGRIIPSITKNEFYDKYNYVSVPNLIDPQLLDSPIYIDKGQVIYKRGEVDCISEVEPQVEGAFAIHSAPQYKEAQYQIRKKLENIIGCELYNTYYYERYYYPGQELFPHMDKEQCEISVSVHVKTNLPDKYEFCLIDRQDNFVEIDMKPGDGVIYKGIQTWHWRNKMPGKKRNVIRKLLRKTPYYYHQVFFHYVLANGRYTAYAGKG